MTTTSGNVQSLERALTLLDALAEMPDGATLKAISEKTNLNKSTAHRLLHTLIAFGYVQQEEENEKYFLGLKLLHLSNTLIEGMDVHSVARPYLKELCDKTGESVHLTVRNGPFAVYVDKFQSNTNSIRMFSQVGKAIPLYCSASGKIFLAWMEKQKAEVLLQAQPMHAFTKNTIVDFNTLFLQLSKVHEQGYAIDWFEHEENIYCVAAPLFDRNQRIVAAISLAGTSLQCSPEKILDYCAEVNRVGAAISEKLGATQYPHIRD